MRLRVGELAWGLAVCVIGRVAVEAGVEGVPRDVAVVSGVRGHVRGLDKPGVGAGHHRGVLRVVVSRKVPGFDLVQAYIGSLMVSLLVLGKRETIMVHSWLRLLLVIAVPSVVQFWEGYINRFYRG